MFSKQLCGFSSETVCFCANISGRFRNDAADLLEVESVKSCCCLRYRWNFRCLALLAEAHIQICKLFIFVAMSVRLQTESKCSVCFYSNLTP